MGLTEKTRKLHIRFLTSNHNLTVSRNKQWLILLVLLLSLGPTMSPRLS
jgi:hypothetical protein